MKFLKKFETHSAYNTYINGQDKILPNVSYCKNENELHYNPWTDPKLVCKYNITDTSSVTTLRTVYGNETFKSMEIDGVLLDNMVTSYQFDTTGEHIVKYELLDETTLGNNSSPIFNQISTVTSVSIPSSVTSISSAAFQNCTGLTSVTIPSNVNDLWNYTFYGCSNLTSITIKATTPPDIAGSLSSDTAFGNTNDCPIYVPSASVETYKATDGWSSYASRIQAIPTI